MSGKDGESDSIDIGIECCRKLSNSQYNIVKFFSSYFLLFLCNIFIVPRLLVSCFLLVQEMLALGTVKNFFYTFFVVVLSGMHHIIL